MSRQTTTATDGIRSNWDPEIWDPEIQHGSPPLALLTKAIEELNNRPAATELRVVARLTAWLLRPSDTRDAATDRHPPLTGGRAAEVSHAWEGTPGYLETGRWRRARGSTGPDGIGVTTAEIFDRQGFIGTCGQTLLVQRRA